MEITHTLTGGLMLIDGLTSGNRSDSAAIVKKDLLVVAHPLEPETEERDACDGVNKEKSLAKMQRHIDIAHVSSPTHTIIDCPTDELVSEARAILKSYREEPVRECNEKSLEFSG